jgi:hypothetical protein
MKKAISILLSGAFLAACAHVESTDGGDAVRVDWGGKVAGCRDVGVIAVSVADKISFYHFSADRIAAKLEMLARNEAARLPADTIVPRNEVTDGTQRFEAYVCGNTQLRQRGADSAQALQHAATQDDAQTIPLKHP